MSSTKLRLIALTALALTALAVAFVAAMATSSKASRSVVPKAMNGEPGEGTAVARPAPRRPEGFSAEDARAAHRAYPADQVEVAWVQNARQTFSRIATRTAKSPPSPGLFNIWQNYGPQMHASEPGILNFSGAPYNTASRTASIVVAPSCGNGFQLPCRMWVGPVGGGVWRTDDATAADPVWTPVGQNDLGINSIGDIVLDPRDITEQTLYAGTGEPNNCSSGCEAGTGLYRSTNGGMNWTPLPAVCVNTALLCTTPNVNAFLGRGISEIAVDPTIPVNQPAHLIVGSAAAIRSMSHIVEGPEAQVRNEPGANQTALYESFDGGATFQMIWNPYSVPAQTPLRRGIFDIEFDPLDANVVYASALARGVYRRCLSGTRCGGEVNGVTGFQPVFNPRHTNPLGRERTHFDLTTKNGNTRIYLTTGELGSAPNPGEPPSSFWRADGVNTMQSGPLAGSETNTLQCPYTGPGWGLMTANTTASPCWATRNFCEPQCWYDQDVFTPVGLPDTVYVIGSFGYGEVPCYTKGVGCGSGISNGRAVLYSTTAGDPDAGFNNRTFTDMTFDAQNVPASWCAYNQISTPCLVAHHSIHPDQHEIVINPGNPTQFFEGSDGGINRSNGSFINMSRACFFRAAPSAGVPALSGNALTQCMRLLSRVPETLGAINTRLGNTLQFINVAADPLKPCSVIGGTQDNGTWMNNCDANDFTQVIYGDGGNAAFDTYYDQSAASNGQAWVANEYTSGANNVNFHNGAGAGDLWLDVFYPPLLSGELFDFYWPQISDPNPPLFNGTGVCNQFLPACVRTHPLYSAGQHVWRSWAWGAGDQGQVPQDVTPDITWYEANCSDLYITPLQCGDFQPMGGPAGSPNQNGDLTGNVYGNDRLGLEISWISRRAADRNIMWATTATGRVFITRNVDAVDPVNVVWERIDNLPTPAFSGNCPVAGGGVNGTAPPGGAVNCSPDRHPNGIYPDPGNPDVAYIAYSGYNAATPGTPGHLFRVTIIRNGAGVATGSVFTNLGVEGPGGTSTFPTPTNTGDLPVNDVAMNDANGVLYAATDFGVLKGTPAGGGTFAWGTTPGMPRFEVAHLAMTPGQRDACRACGPNRILYAATHSMGIWLMQLS